MNIRIKKFQTQSWNYPLKQKLEIKHERKVGIINLSGLIATHFLR
jgi:hypothetical protein